MRNAAGALLLTSVMARTSRSASGATGETTTGDDVPPQQPEDAVERTAAVRAAMERKAVPGFEGHSMLSEADTCFGMVLVSSDNLVLICGGCMSVLDALQA